MTSKASQHSANIAPSSTVAPAAPSYASAAGAAKKPSSTPAATASNQPVVAAGTTKQAPSHAKPSDVSPVNGRPNVMPAIPAGVPTAPAVANGTVQGSLSANGQAEHTRKSSVTMSANGPNSYAGNSGSSAGKPPIQFGYQESPATSHSTPQPPSAPIPIPSAGGRSVTEPRHSPSPIPIPSASGGRPPSGVPPAGATVNFGSFDGDRSHMRNPSAASHEPSALGPPHPTHIRRESNVSDISNHNGPATGGPNRGNFSANNRSNRSYGGGFNHNQSVGYPPANSYRGQQGNQPRGNMTGNFSGNNRPPHHYPNQANRSPAMASAIPQSGAGGMPPFYYSAPPVGPNQQVHYQPFPFSSVPHGFDRAPPKMRKRGFHRDGEKFSNHHRRQEPFGYDHNFSQRPRRFSGRSESLQCYGFEEAGPSGQVNAEPLDDSPTHSLPMAPQPFSVFPPRPCELGHLDLSPESGNFDRLLTSVKQNPYYQYDPRTQMPPQMGQMGYPAYPNMHHVAGSPIAQFQQPAFIPQFSAPLPQPMSRSNSQIAEQRPGSGAGQPPAPVPQGTPQQQAAQLKQVANPSPHFARPAKRNAAIPITNENGERLDFKSLKPAAPASPAASHHSRTPPVVSSTPTPPPKASTPKPYGTVHGRTDSSSNVKTAEEKRNEFMEKIKQTATGEKAKEDDAAKATPEPAPAASQPETTPTTENAAKPAETAESAPVEPVKEAEVKTEDKAAEVAKPEPEASKPSDEPDEDELERIIREMEEADARREAEEKQMNEKRAAEKEAKKKAEQEAAAANAAENDRKLREQEAEMERLEAEKERKRAAPTGGPKLSVEEQLKMSPEELRKAQAISETAAKAADPSVADKQASVSGTKPSPSVRAPKPQALNLAPLNTKTVEAPQPSAALQSLKTARLLDRFNADIYPAGIRSPNPAINPAVEKKGRSFKYDSAFLLQFKPVFTEQPSLDFHQQVKNLIGDGDGGRSASTRSAGGSSRQNTRNSTSSFPMMGNFGTGGSQALPASAMSNKGIGGSRPGMNSISSFQRPGGAFGGGSQMSRQPSSTMGSMPHSPRQSSRRNASKPNTIKSEQQAAKTMPLTAGKPIEALTTSSTGWKPLSVGKSSAPSSQPTGADHMDPAMVQRKVKAALNKMTPDNFDRISDQILQIAAQSKDETDGRTLRQVIQLTFEKATDEAHWASMYAKFCKKMLETMSPEIRDENIKDKNGNVVSGGALFRKYLLNRCQEEFERGWKMQLPEQGADGDRTTQAAALLSDEYYKAAAAKRRGLGLVQFIGELYKLAMLTERIMHECVRKLVDYQGIPDEAEVESLSKLLRTIGWNLDNAEKGKPMMDVYFQRIQTMIELPGMPSRMQFMLMDVVDLRKNNWQSKEANKGPKTLEEIRAEAEAQAAQKAAESARNNQRGGGGRAQLGRGDARHLQGGYPQSAPNQVGIDDLRRLKGGASRASSTNLTLGPMSMLGSRSNSGRRLGPGGSLSRGADDSAASSRTGTPPVREAPTSTNSFGLLATMDSDHPGSPPSTAASPAMTKATPDTSSVTEKGEN
ncbi:hypothetical protein F5Y17DRAFT_458664 [Xylariaceae sp. FL0594]|nr:hypothetical protein F5Y17DRAFT_458664 [Xylariaceae sp. FL0594]